MTNPDLTLVAFLVDRSGSMAAIKSDMEGGIASIIEAQKAEAGDTLVSIAQFDSQYETVYQLVNVNDVKPFVLNPRGATALNDATGKFITEIGEKLAALPEDERPGAVIVQIITDGHENASQEWKLDAVKKLIEKQTNDYNWVFSFMGSDITTESSARSYGISASNTIRYSTEAVDTGMNASIRFISDSRGVQRAENGSDRVARNIMNKARIRPELFPGMEEKYGQAVDANDRIDTAQMKDDFSAAYDKYRASLDSSV